MWVSIVRLGGFYSILRLGPGCGVGATQLGHPLVANFICALPRHRLASPRGPIGRACWGLSGGTAGTEQGQRSQGTAQLPRGTSASICRDAGDAMLSKFRSHPLTALFIYLVCILPAFFSLVIALALFGVSFGGMPLWFRLGSTALLAGFYFNRLVRWGEAYQRKLDSEEERRMDGDS
jgi:hypothetical protein